MTATPLDGMPTTHPDDELAGQGVEPAGTTAAGRGRRRSTLWIAAGAAVALVAAGALVAVRTAAAHERDAALTEYSAAAADRDAATAELLEVRSRAEPLVDLGDQVSTPTPVTELVAAMDAATVLPEAPQVDSAEASASLLRQAAAEARDLAEQTRSATGALTAAAAAVQASHEAWLLDRAVADHGTALEELASAIAAGEQDLAATDGQVLDNAVREQLRAALDTATTIRQAQIDAGDSAALTAAAAKAREASAGVAAARQATLDAHAAWQAEQDRVAAERAAAAQQSSSNPSSSKGSSSRSTGSSQSGSSSQATPGSSPADDGSHWEQSEGWSGQSGGVCMDTHGKSWECG